MSVSGVLRRRRFFFFAIGFSLLGVVVLALSLMRCADASRAAAQITAVGGRVNWFLEDTANLNVAEAFFARLLNVEFAYSVNLTGCHVGRTELNALSKFPRLGSLYLKGTDVRASDLEVLLALKELRYLDISDTSVNGDAVETLSNIGTLKDIILSGTEITLEQRQKLQQANAKLVIH